MGPVGAVVEDISRGGVRLLLDETRVDLRGERCVVRFRGSTVQLRPVTSRGRIRRTTQADDTFSLAIEFTEPLVSLQLEPA